MLDLRWKNISRCGETKPVRSGCQREEKITMSREDEIIRIIRCRDVI